MDEIINQQQTTIEQARLTNARLCVCLSGMCHSHQSVPCSFICACRASRLSPGAHVLQAESHRVSQAIFDFVDVDSNSVLTRSHITSPPYSWSHHPLTLLVPNTCSSAHQGGLPRALSHGINLGSHSARASSRVQVLEHASPCRPPHSKDAQPSILLAHPRVPQT